ncbi:MAG: hypothetical protein K2X48_12605 [Chitinophagaceae bacterium]|nr:hypothetical protein [Chitinophagaceae bacterium]
MTQFKTILLLLFVFIFLKSNGQVNCNTLDVNNVPGKWVWQKGGYGNQWQMCEPIRKEMQRIMPVALDGLHATNSIAFGDNTVFWHTKSPAAYECYLMLKKFECLKGYNELRPEGETGCWIYFSVNQIDGVKFPIPCQSTELKYHEYESNIRVANIEVKTDAAGNKIIYSSYRAEEVLKHCYFFSTRKDLPLRKLTNKELFTSYKIYHEKRLTEKIAQQEKIVAEYEKRYNNMSASEKQKGDYRSQQFLNGMEYLKNLKLEKENIIPWYNTAMKQANINETAYVKKVNSYNFIPKELEAADGDGYNVWVDNLDFFDKTKPKDAIQCIALYIRRQDDELPKKNFMDLFFSRFNLDVLCKIVGEPVKKPIGFNYLDASLGDVKTESKTNQNNISNYNYSFEKNTLNQFPQGWNGMKNNTVQQFENKNWLAFTKDGYCYPQQFNKEIKDNFNLSFNLSWNKDVAYNSGLFTVSFSEIPYDNAAERYKMDYNQNQYWSLYDSYVGKFNRVMIWLDPYWNGGGTLEVYSYDKNENTGVKKRITLPDFYMAKNSHNIKIQRKGSSLVVFINDKKEAEIENVFIPFVKYNLYTFSRYKGNNSDNKNDVFFLDNINVNY